MSHETSVTVIDGVQTKVVVNEQTGVVHVFSVGVQGPSGTTLHESLTDLQGGAANDHYHLTQAQRDDLTDGGNTTLHIHDSRYYTETESDVLFAGKENAGVAQGLINAHKVATGDHALSVLSQSGASSGQVPSWDGSAWVPVTPSAGVTDHGALTGLGDDDHTQYHNDARALTWLGTRSTSDLAEGSNLYYTTTRFNTDFATKTTTDLAEGSNLYFTNARAIGSTLTGYTSGAGTISSSDSILSAIQKLNGNAALVTGVSSVSNSDGTLTISPTTGAVVASRAAITGDVSVPSASNTATLATINSNVGTFNTLTVNGKGLVTSAANTSYESPLTLTSPLSRSVNTISIPAATSSVNGYLTSTDWNTFNGKESALTFSTGLTRSSNTITANLSTGVSGGQTAIGGTASGNNLTLSSTTNVTKGKILFGTSAYDEVNNNLGIGLTSPTNYAGYSTIEATGTSGNSGGVFQTTSFGGTLKALFYTDTLIAKLGTSTAHPIYFNTSNSPRLSILSTGEVGVGTTTQATGTKLEIRATSSDNSAADLYAANGTPYNLRLTRSDLTNGTGQFFFDASGNFQIRNTHASGSLYFNTANGTASSPKLTLTSAGLLGIGAGSNTISQKLHIWGDATNEANIRLTPNSNGVFYGIEWNNTSNGSASHQVKVFQGTGEIRIGTASNSGFTTIYDNFGENTRFTSGNVGITATVPSSKLEVRTNALGTTQTTTSGLALANTTAAAAGAQQISPALRFSSNGWKTNATAASQDVSFRNYSLPVQGTATPTGILKWDYSVNGASFADTATLTTAGIFSLPQTGSYYVAPLGSTGGTAQFRNDTYNTGVQLVNNDEVRMIGNGFDIIMFKGLSTSQIRRTSTAVDGWSSSTNNTTALDTAFSRLSANKLALGNGTASDLTGTLVLGAIGIGQTTPTAYLHIKAGTATASTAPLKFTSGTDLTSPENGAIEYDGSDLKITTGGTRKFLNKILRGSATLDFGNTAAQNSTDLTITVTGAADGDAVSLGVPNASVSANSSYSAWVSAADTVTVRFNNYSSGAIDPASGTFKVSVSK